MYKEVKTDRSRTACSSIETAVGPYHWSPSIQKLEHWGQKRTQPLWVAGIMTKTIRYPGNSFGAIHRLQGAWAPGSKSRCARSVRLLAVGVRNSGRQCLWSLDDAVIVATTVTRYRQFPPFWWREKTLLGPPSRFGDNLLGIWAVCPHNRDCSPKWVTQPKPTALIRRYQCLFKHDGVEVASWPLWLIPPPTHTLKRATPPCRAGGLNFLRSPRTGWARHVTPPTWPRRRWFDQPGSNHKKPLINIPEFFTSILVLITTRYIYIPS